MHAAVGRLPRLATEGDKTVSTRSNRNVFPVHLLFLVVLFTMLMLKYYLYFASPVTGTGLNPGRIGATFAHLTIWAIAYSICFKGNGTGLLLGIGIPTVLVGMLTVPLLGFLGLIILYVVYRAQRRAIDETESTDSGDAQLGGPGREAIPRPRMARPSSGGHLGSSVPPPPEWTRDGADT